MVELRVFFVVCLYVISLVSAEIGTEGGVIIEDPLLNSDIIVEEHTRIIDEYFLVRRCIDRFILKNSGESIIKGIYTEHIPKTYLLYYDDLGSIDKKHIHKNLYVLGFRYPLRPSERISFTVETLSFRDTSKKSAGVWPFAEAVPVVKKRERTYFYIWKIE